MDDLKKGKSNVLETDHILVLGWSDKIFCLIEQLCMGYELRGGRPVRGRVGGFWGERLVPESKR